MSGIITEVNEELGIALILGGSAVALAAAFILRVRLPSAVVALALAVAGVAVAAGGLLVQDEVQAYDWVVALPLMAALTPLHVRFVLGPLGRNAPAGTGRNAHLSS